MLWFPPMAGLKARLPFLIFLRALRLRSHQFCCRSRSYRRVPYLHRNDSLVGSFAELCRLLSSCLDCKLVLLEFSTDWFLCLASISCAIIFQDARFQIFTRFFSSWSIHVSTFVTWVKGFQLKSFRRVGEEELGCWKFDVEGRIGYGWFPNLVLGSGSRAYGIGSQIYASVNYPFSVHVLSCSRFLHLASVWRTDPCLNCFC